MGVSTTHRINLSMYYVWAACALTGSTKVKRNDETKTSVPLISFAIWQRFFMYWEKLFSRRTQSDQSDPSSKGIQQTVSLTASDSSGIFYRSSRLSESLFMNVWFWLFWDQRNCPYYRAVRKERLDCIYLICSNTDNCLDSKISWNKSFL